VTCDACPPDRLFASFLLFLGYGLAIIPSTYLFSYVYGAGARPLPATHF
jgi:hypothetical protein